MQLPDGKVVSMKTSRADPCCSTPIKADEGAARAISSVARQWAGRDLTVSSKPLGGKGAGKTTTGEVVEGASIAPMSLDSFIDRARTHTFSISAMAFQDAWNIALDRVRDCCIHVMAPDGRLIPFCLYNLTAADGRRLYRP